VLPQDIESYTSLSQQCEAEDVMNMLHTLFSVFDALTTKHGVFKVETIGKPTTHACPTSFQLPLAYNLQATIDRLAQFTKGRWVEDAPR
jgi:class 3 adenylate cyclase